jgi:hypothetical protein
MELNQAQSETLTRIVQADTTNFKELCRLAGLDPARAFRFSNLSDVDFSDCDLSGFDFTGANLAGGDFRRAKYDKAIFKDAVTTNVKWASHDRDLRTADAAYEITEIAEGPRPTMGQKGRDATVRRGADMQEVEVWPVIWGLGITALFLILILGVPTHGFISQLAIGFSGGIFVGMAFFSNPFARTAVTGLIAGVIIGAIMIDSVEGFANWATYLTKLTAFCFGLIAGIVGVTRVWSTT